VWANETHEVLKARGTLVHGGFLRRWKGREMTPALIAHKTGEVIDVDIDQLDALIASAERLSAQGRKYSTELLGEFIHLMDGKHRCEG